MTENHRTESYTCQELIVRILPSILEPMVTIDEKQAFSDRLNAILDMADIPPKGQGRERVLAKYFGVTEKGARKWIAGDGFPRYKNLVAIVAKFKDTGVTVEWLLTDNPAYAPDLIRKQMGISEPSESYSNTAWLDDLELWNTITPLRDDDVELPVFIEVELSAESGRCEVQKTGLALRFPKLTLKKKAVDAAQAAYVTVYGNSMEPVIPAGAPVVIDTGSTAIKNGDMYAIDHNGHLRVQLVYKISDGGLRLRSYNSNEWPDEHYNGDAVDNIKILGRVFWYSVLI